MSAPDSTAAPKAKAKRPPWDRFWLRALAAALTGMCMVWSAPEHNYWLLAFVAWLPLFWAIEGLSPRRALLMGCISGTTAVFVGFLWMTELLTRFAGLPISIATPIHFLFGVYHSLAWGLPVMIIVWLRRRGCAPNILWTAPMAWVVVEAFMPNIFPTYIGMLWAWHPLWIQSAEFGGVTMVSFIMLAVNAGFYEIWLAWREDARDQLRTPIIFTLTLLVVVPTFGAIRISQVDDIIEAAPKLRMGAVQGNFGIHTYTRPKNKRLILKEMQRVSAELEADGAQVVAWGETAYPYVVFGRKEGQHDFPVKDLRHVRRGFNIPVIFGAITVDKTRENPYPWNTAFAMNSEGLITGRYDKNYPLVFGEYVPIVDPEWFMDLIPSASHLNRGQGPEMLDVAGYPIGTMICFEDILPSFTRETVNAGASVLVNLTNDSWFGKSSEQAEHLALAVFRSVEHRRGLLRVVNAGISAYVDPAGRVVAKTEVTDSDVEGYDKAVGFAVDVPMIEPSFRTVFGYTGHTFGFLCLLGLLFVGRRRDPDARKANQSPPPSTTTENAPQTKPHIQ